MALCLTALGSPGGALPSPPPSARAFNRSQALDKALLKYNQLLASRHAKMSEVSALEGQNNELKALLNQYLASKVGSAADRRTAGARRLPKGREPHSASPSSPSAHPIACPCVPASSLGLLPSSRQVNEDLICPPTQTIRLDEYASFQNTGPTG